MDYKCFFFKKHFFSTILEGHKVKIVKKGGVTKLEGAPLNRHFLKKLIKDSNSGEIFTVIRGDNAKIHLRGGFITPPHSVPGGQNHLHLEEKWPLGSFEIYRKVS